MKVNLNSYFSIAPSQKACKKLRHRLSKENPSVSFEISDFRATLAVKKNTEENELFLSLANKNKDSTSISLYKGTMSGIKKFLTDSVQVIDDNIRCLKYNLKLINNEFNTFWRH